MAVQIGIILLESNLTGDGSARMKMYNPLTQQPTSGNQSDRNNPAERGVLCMEITTSALSIIAKIRTHLSVQGLLSKLRLINSIEHGGAGNRRPSGAAEAGGRVEWARRVWELCALCERTSPYGLGADGRVLKG